MISEHIEIAVERERKRILEKINLMKEPYLRKTLDGQSLTQKELFKLEILEDIIDELNKNS